MLCRPSDTPGPGWKAGCHVEGARAELTCVGIRQADESDDTSGRPKSKS